MKTTLARLSLAAIALAACSTAPVAQLSPLAAGLTLLPIAERIDDAEDEIDCGAPGGGGGFSGAGPHGEPLAHHLAFISCQYPTGTLEELAAAWGEAGTAYLETVGVDVTDPGSFSGDGLRGLTWEYTSGDATGVLTITVVRLGDASYRLVGNLVEFAPKG